MGSMGGEGFWWKFPHKGHRLRRGTPKSSSQSIGASGGAASEGFPFNFPLKQAAIASSLALTGDTVAQVRDWLVTLRRAELSSDDDKDIVPAIWANYDWLRAMRMASYGFLLYGPGTYVWYQFLDRCMPKPTFVNLSAKVILNQIFLGPCVIAVIFAWNSLWLRKLSELPSKYQKDALPTLLYGFRFWIPVTIVNFGLVPLSGRVAFMSGCSIFWNFYLSSTLSK